MIDQAEKLRNMVEEKKGAGSGLESSQQSEQSNIAKVYAITSGKGGVGKSNFVANLALALQEEGQKVLVFDADLGLANLDVILGATPNYTLNHVISGAKTLEEIIIRGAGDLPLIPGGSGIEELANLSKHQINNLIRHWQEIEQKYDIILIDTGAGLSDKVLDFVLAADEIILISTTEPTSITDAYGVIKVVSNHDPEVEIKLVINRVEKQKEGRQIGERLISTAEEFLDLEIDFLGDLPEDKAVVKAVKNRRPFWLEFPKSKVVSRMNSIVTNLLDKSDPKESSLKGFFSNMFGL